MDRAHADIAPRCRGLPAGRWLGASRARVVRARAGAARTEARMAHLYAADCRRRCRCVDRGGCGRPAVAPRYGIGTKRGCYRDDGGGAKGRRPAPGSMLPRFRNPLRLQRESARLRRRPSGRLFPNGRPRLRRLRRPQPKETFWQRLTKRPLRLWYRRQPLRGPKPGRWTMRRPRWRRRPAERSPADTGPRNRADPCRSRFRPAAACREMRQTPPPGEA